MISDCVSPKILLLTSRSLFSLLFNIFFNNSSRLQIQIEFFEDRIIIRYIVVVLFSIRLLDDNSLVVANIFLLVERNEFKRGLLLLFYFKVRRTVFFVAIIKFYRFNSAIHKFNIM